MGTQNKMLKLMDKRIFTFDTDFFHLLYILIYDDSTLIE